MGPATEIFKDFLKENSTKRTFTFIVDVYERDTSGAKIRKNITAPTLAAALVKAAKFSVGDSLSYYGFPVDLGELDSGAEDISIEEFEEFLNSSDEDIAEALDETNGDGGDYIIIMEGDKQWTGHNEYYEDDEDGYGYDISDAYDGYDD